MNNNTNDPDNNIEKESPFHRPRNHKKIKISSFNLLNEKSKSKIKKINTNNKKEINNNNNNDNNNQTNDKISCPVCIKKCDGTYDVMDLPIFRMIRHSIIGKDEVLPGPYGYRKLLYCDYTASGRVIQFIEDYIRYEVMPYYANTHTEASLTGFQTNTFREDARYSLLLFIIYYLLFILLLFIIIYYLFILLLLFIIHFIIIIYYSFYYYYLLFILLFIIIYHSFYY